MKRSNLAVAILMIAGITSTASAQVTGDEGFGRVAGLFRLERVQKELNMTDEQVASLREKLKIRITADNNPRDLSLSVEERRKRRDELDKKRDELIKAALDEKQQKRLRQLQLQLRRADALLYPQVAERLDLDLTQKAKLKKIQEEFPHPGFPRRRNLSDEERRRWVAKAGERRKIRTAASFVVLTDQQKKIFTKMQGEKFDFGFPRRNQEQSEQE